MNRLEIAVEKSRKVSIPVEFTSRIHTVEVDAEKAATFRRYGRLSRAFRRVEASMKDAKLGLALPEVGRGEK